MGRINYGYAFGPRIKYGAGSGTRWQHKSGAIIASTGEKCGLSNTQYLSAAAQFLSCIVQPVDRTTHMMTYPHYPHPLT